jgi:putative addiction module killer protein
MDTMQSVNILNRTAQFDAWLSDLTDLQARAKILVRIKRAERNLFGDCKPVGGGVSEMRVDFGPGYRIYFGREAGFVYLLLCGGDKSGQDVDIKRAKALWETIRREQACARQKSLALMSQIIWTAKK